MVSTIAVEIVRVDKDTLKLRARCLRNKATT